MPSSHPPLFLRLLAFFLILLLPHTSSAAAASAAATSAAPADDALLADARAAESRLDARTALDLYLRADATRPDDPFILQKISRQYSDLTNDTPDPAEKKRLCTAALAYAQRAVALDPANPVNVLSLAICYGKLGLYSDTRTRIEYSRLVHQHAEQALALDPAYDYAHHVLGRWHYEVATLGATKRFLVRLIYGGLPSASTAEAVRHLQRAVELSPQTLSHHVELGLVLLADAQPAAARRAFEHALTLPTREKHDDEARRRAREALAQL